MDSHALPPLVAAVVAIALRVEQSLTALLIELPVDTDAAALTRYTLLGRVAAFALVYGLLFGAAYWAGTTSEDDRDHVRDASRIAVLTFVAGTVAALASTAVMVGFAGTGTWGLVRTGFVAAGSGLATGVHLGVVAFAGVVAGQWNLG